MHDAAAFYCTAPRFRHVDVLLGWDRIALQQRLSELLEKNRTVGLNQAELDEFLRMNRFMSRLRLKARLRLSE